MALSSTHRSCPVPLYADLGGKGNCPEALQTPAPIYIVTNESQLPQEFLVPSNEKKLVIGFGCEGDELCHSGTLCIMQLAFPDAIYLVDAINGGMKLMQACKPALESSYIKKVIHDCKRDSEALYFQFGIKLHNVMDTQIAYALIEKQQGCTRLPDHNISFVDLLADPRYCDTWRPIHISHDVVQIYYMPLVIPRQIIKEGVNVGISYREETDVRALRQYPKYWKHRPMIPLMVRVAAHSVRFLPHIYQKMMGRLNEQSSWQVEVRSGLHSRCFCISDNQNNDWPPVTCKPDNLILEEEILSLLKVPPGKMGCLIGKRGASIMSVRESCNVEIIIGGTKGPSDKVCIIGPMKQVRKAEAILRGRISGFAFV